MSPPRLPAGPVMRCVLAFSIGTCIVLPIGLIVMLLRIRDHNLEWPAPVNSVSAQGPANEVADSQSDDAGLESPPSAEPKSGFVSTQIAEMIASSQRQSADENLSELDAMSKKLNSVASEESVDDLANSVQRWMGLESRASKSKAVTEIDEFEIDTAQLNDVQRTERNLGKFEYTAVLIDAQGRTLDIKMTEAEGRETYVLMRRIKANPLLEKIYRRIAMPLLDSLVQSARNQVKLRPPDRAAP